MPNMDLKKAAMPVQEPAARAHNFDEVALGYSARQALGEAERCLQCKNSPCVSQCPVAVDIPGFIRKIKENDPEGAYQILRRTSSLPAVCGRVCPQESQCESVCVRGIKGEPVGIGRLERFAADWHMENAAGKPEAGPSNGRRVAVVGSGPAGLTCAGDLRRMGYGVTVFEALHMPGGVLVYGIPEFRLPKAIVSAEIENLRAMGVEIVANSVVGKLSTVDELLGSGYEAVFIGSGAGLPRFMGIPGENLRGVYSANEFLTRVNLMKAYLEGSDTPVQRARKVAVVGGGNVAMDAARCALRLGAEEAHIVYRRSDAEMPARREEIEHAKEEGVLFDTLTNPVEIIGDGNHCVKAMSCVRMELGEPDASGRRRPVTIDGSAFTFEADCVIIAIGTSPNPLLHTTTSGLEVNRRGGIVTEEGTGQTSREAVFAGGDAVTGAATVILAMGAGKNAAAAIDKYIRAKSGA